MENQDTPNIVENQDANIKEPQTVMPDEQVEVKEPEARDQEEKAEPEESSDKVQENQEWDEEKERIARELKQSETQEAHELAMKGTQDILDIVQREQIVIAEEQQPVVQENVQDEIIRKFKRSQPMSQNQQLTGMQSKQNGSLIGFLPLTELNVDVEIQDSVALIKMTQEYINPCQPYCDPQPQDANKNQDKVEENADSAPIEVTFQFPKEPNSVISKMLLTVGNKTIEAKVMENEKAEEKYDDEIAQGNVAALLKKNKNSFDLHQIDIGNILPGEFVIVQLVIVQPLKIQGGAYDFIFPMSYYPRYQKPIDNQVQGQVQAQATEPKVISDLKEGQKLLFNYRVTLKSTKAIYEISHPANCEILEQNLNEVMIQKIDSDFRDLQKDMHVYYKTTNMDEPRFVYQKSNDMPGYVAVMAQFMPTFEASQPQENQEQKIIYIDNEEEFEEKEIDTSIETKYVYSFVVDRSGSMGFGRGKMEVTVEALKLFIQSLPVGSQFQIISFGSRHEFLKNNDYQQTFDYTNENVQWAKDMFDTFDANFGGTNIYEPLKDIFQRNIAIKDKKSRIFLLTDGQISDRERVIDLVKQECQCSVNDNQRVFSFGIGDDCDKTLIKQMAEAGGGNYNFASDSNLSVLKSKVIDALSKASEPALSGCTFNFGVPSSSQQQNDESLMNSQQNMYQNQLYRNQLARFVTVMKEEDFNNISTCSFSCEFDPKTQKSFSHQFDKQRFTELQTAEGSTDYLFKMACKNKINDLIENGGHKSLIIELSTKYQVLSAETSFIGVVKQKNKNKNETKKIRMPTISSISKKGDSSQIGIFSNRMAKKSMRKGMAAPQMSQSSYGGFGGSSMRSLKKNQQIDDLTKLSNNMQSLQQQQSMMMSQNAMLSSVDRGSNMGMMMDQSDDLQMRSMKSSNKKSAKKSKGMFGGRKAAPVQQVEKAAKSGGGIFSKLFGSFGSKAKKSEPLRSEMMSDAMDCMQDEQKDMNVMKSSISKQSANFKSKRNMQFDNAEMMQDDLMECDAMNSNSLDQGNMLSANMGMCVQSCAASAVPSQPSFNKPPSYDNVINSQSIDGSWSSKDLNMLLTYLPSDRHSEIRKIISSHENETEAITLLALCILMNLYLEDRDEWKLIEKKARRFVNLPRGQDACSSQFDTILKQIQMSDEDQMLERLMAL